MVELLEVFIYKGIDYYQIKRSYSNCVYELSHKGNILHYEVFAIPITTPRSLTGRLRESIELYAQNSDFGKTAFMYKSFYSAMIKFYELEKVRDENSILLKRRTITGD